MEQGIKKRSNTHDDPLDATQEKAVEMLYLGKKSHVDIAEVLNVAPSTLTKWKKQNSFREALAEYSSLARKKSAKLLDTYKESAALTLVQLLSPDVQDAVRLASAKEILAFGEKNGIDAGIAENMNVVFTSVKKLSLDEWEEMSQ